MIIPASLRTSCARDPGRNAWLAALPALLDEVTARWRLDVAEPFDGNEGGCAWVAPARRDGETVILKASMPHLEGEHEIAGLRVWDGDPTVQLLKSDEARGIMLLEACEPGTHLRSVPEPEQDVVLAGLLRRLWRVPGEPHPFRPLAEMTAAWAAETERDSEHWVDAGLVRDGLALFGELPRTAPDHVLLATDLHAGNVLRAAREPWLVIDPKPFVGDPAYDATQHLFNCTARLSEDPLGLIARFAGLLEIDAERVALWMFARAAAESRDSGPERSIELARRLAP